MNKHISAVLAAMMSIIILVTLYITLTSSPATDVSTTKDTNHEATALATSLPRFSAAHPDVPLIKTADVQTEFRYQFPILIPLNDQGDGYNMDNELDIIRKITNLQNDETLRMVSDQSQHILDIFQVNGRSVRTFINERQTPATLALIDTLNQEMGMVLSGIQGEMDIARPIDLDATLQIVGEVPLEPAFPHRRIAQAVALARLLSQIEPEYRTYFFAEAARIARAHVIAGHTYQWVANSTYGFANEYISDLYFRDTELKQSLLRSQAEWPVTALQSTLIQAGVVGNYTPAAHEFVLF